MSMIPKSLKYGNKAEASMARSYTSNIQPNGALNDYRQGSVTTFMIPTGPNLALVSPESVLKFKVTTLGADDGRLDSAGAHGYIQRIRIWHGSNQIEDTDNYGLLAKKYFDLQVSTDASYGKYSILAGTRNDEVARMFDAAVVAAVADATDGATANTLANALKAAVVKGGSSTCINSGSLVTFGVQNTYCITLLSILGSLCSSHYFPLFECTAAPIRLEIQWAPSIQAVGAFAGTTTGFKIDEIEYIASYIALSNEAMGLVRSAYNGPLTFTVQGVRNYNTTANLPNGATTQVNFNIPAKFASVKNIIACCRDTARGVNTNLYFPFSMNKNGLQSYNFKIGSHSSIPAIAPSTDAQYFAELLKAVGSISDLNHEPSIDITSYIQASSVVNTAATIAQGSVNSGSFMIGLDLESYAQSDKSTIYTGYNTKNDDVILSLTFVPPAAIASARMDAFVMFDQELIFANGTCYVSF